MISNGRCSSFFPQEHAALREWWTWQGLAEFTDVLRQSCHTAQMWPDKLQGRPQESQTADKSQFYNQVKHRAQLESWA